MVANKSIQWGIQDENLKDMFNIFLSFLTKSLPFSPLPQSTSFIKLFLAVYYIPGTWENIWINGYEPCPSPFLTLPLVGSWHSPRLWQRWAAGQSAYLHLIYSSLSSKIYLSGTQAPSPATAGSRSLGSSLSLVDLPSCRKPLPEEPVLPQAAETLCPSPSRKECPSLSYLLLTVVFIL